MALGDNYATLDELKAYLSLTGQSAVDDQMSDALNSASQEIERFCGRQFNRVETASVRVFRPMTSSGCWMDDIWSTTGFVLKSDADYDGVYETTWAAADYELRPLNGMVNGVPGWPYYKITAVGTANRFPVWRANLRETTVQVTALWGWTTVPAPVKQACLILAAMAFQLKDAPLGVAGMGEFGVIRVRNSQMAEQKLMDYVRQRVGVA